MKYNIHFSDNNRKYNCKVESTSLEGAIRLFRLKEAFKYAVIISVILVEPYIPPKSNPFDDIFKSFGF